MSDKMDFDSPHPSTRDPRLASRPARPPISMRLSDRQNSASLGSLGTPRSAGPAPPTDPTPPVEKQDDAPGRSFIQALSGLVQTSVATAVSRAEKERLEKRKETTAGLLKKAKAHTNFPSTAAFYQQASNDENVDLSRMDDTIKEQISNCSQIEKGLVAKWGALSPGNSKTEALQNLQNELRAAKAEASNAKADVAKLMEAGSPRPGPIRVLQDRVVFLEKALGNQSSMLNEQGKNARATDERLASLSSEVKKKPVQDPTQYRNDIEDLKQKHTGVDYGIKSMVKSQERVSKSLDQLNLDLDVHRRKLNDAGINSIGTMRKEMDDLYNHLRSLENKGAAKSTAPVNGNVDSKGALRDMEVRLKTLEGNHVTLHKPNEPVSPNVPALNARIDELSHLQAMKDDLQFSEMEEYKRTLAQQAKEVQTLKDGHGQVSTEVKNIAQTNPAVALQQVQALSGSLQATQRVVDSVKVGLHSLETRYNSLSTEPIVKNMVVAMQEMYPSASQLTEQVMMLRSHFDKELPLLRSKMEQMIRSHSAHVQQLQKDTSQRLEETNRIKADYTRIDQSLANVWGRVSVQQGSSPGPGQIQLRVEGLSRRLDEHVSKVNEQLNSKQTSDYSLVQSLNSEREHFNKEFARISTELKSLISKVSHVESSNSTNMGTTKTQWNDIGSLLDRMQRLEESASKNHEQLIEQFENIKKEVENQGVWAVGAREVQNGAPSPPQKVEGDEDDEQEQRESPAKNGEDVNSHAAEASPALALREKKKKRPRPSNLSDDERPTESHADSPRPSTPARGETPLDKKKSKKKKKRKLQDPEPTTVD